MIILFFIIAFMFGGLAGFYYGSSISYRSIENNIEHLNGFRTTSGVYSAVKIKSLDDKEDSG